MGTKGRGALAGLRLQLDESAAALESAKQKQRDAEYLARAEAINAWALKEITKVLADNIEQMKKIGADETSSAGAVNAIAADGRRQTESISRRADQRLIRLREQYRSGETMTPD